MRKLRIGCGGVGRRGRDLVANALRVPECEITALCNLDRAALESCRSRLAADAHRSSQEQGGVPVAITPGMDLWGSAG